METPETQQQPTAPASVPAPGDTANSTSAAAPPTASPTPIAGAPAAAEVGASAASDAPATSPEQPRPEPTGQDAGTADTNNTDPTANEKGNFGHRVLTNILGALGGTTTTSYERDPTTGKMVMTQQQAAPGTQWKRIIAGALTGAAAAAQVKPGPGQIGRGAGAGFTAAEGQVEKLDQQKQTNANEDFDEQQKTTVRKAQVALLNQQLSEHAFDFGRKQVLTKFEDSDRETAFVKSVQGGGLGSTDLGVFPSIEEVVKAHGDMPDLMNQQAKGNIIGTPHINKAGAIEGMHYALVTPEWSKAKTAQDEVFYKMTPPTKPGEQPKVLQQTVKAGTMSNGDFRTAQMASEKEIMEWYGDRQKATEAMDKTKFEQNAETHRQSMKDASDLEVAHAKGGDKPVYAYDPTANETLLTTKEDAQARNLTGIREVKQTDIRADQHDIRVLNDVAAKANNVQAAAGAMDSKSWGQAAMVSRYLADNPNTTAEKLINSSVMKHMNPTAKKYVITVLNLRESSMGLNKVLTGSARTNVVQMQALMNTLPGVEPDSATVGQKLKNFTQNITMMRQGLPKLQGMDTIDLNPETHVFSKRAWQTANPKGDLNAAVNAATQQKFTVTD